MTQKANKRTPSTQRYLNISEIKDDCIVMKDGTLRAILMASSVNFALKSEDEQNAIVSGYVSFLNSLESSLQIVIQSRQLDLDSYLEAITKAEREQTNELLKFQTTEYKQYIGQLVELGDIMTKKFYIVIPYDPSSSSKRSFWSRAGGVLSPAKTIFLGRKQFVKNHKELFSRVDKILSGLSGLGLRSSILNTQSLLELFYNTYNPSVSKRQKISEVDKLNIEDK
jgi:hypothetical protein